MTFQASDISWSNRKRGQLQRTSMKNNTTPQILISNTATLSNAPSQVGSASVDMPQKCQPPRNKITMRNEAVIMCRNSATKKRSNFIPPYSVVISTNQFLLRFRQVKRQTARFGKRGHDKDDEPQRLY